MNRVQRDILKLLEGKIMELVMYESLVSCIRSGFGWEGKTDLEVVMEFRRRMESGSIKLTP